MRRWCKDSANNYDAHRDKDREDNSIKLGERVWIVDRMPEGQRSENVQKELDEECGDGGNSGRGYAGLEASRESVRHGCNQD